MVDKRVPEGIFLNYFVWLRITVEGSINEMRIWSILLIKSYLIWCIHNHTIALQLAHC